MRDFSQALGVGMAQIIKMLMDMGSMKTATQTLTDDEVELIAAELGREVTIKHADDDESEPEAFDDPEESLTARPPVRGRSTRASGASRCRRRPRRGPRCR